MVEVSRGQDRTTMTLSLSKVPVDYTVNSEQLSLPEFVSAYGKSFPHAAIVTQGYCPVEGEEDSEEFSSGEIFIACLKKTIRVLRVQLLGGLHKLSVPINSTIQFALLPEEDDGPPEKLGKEWERKFTSVSDVLDMRILPPAFKVLEDCVDHKQRRVPSGVVLYNITPITMRGLHKKRGIRGISSNQIAYKFLEGQNICFSSHQEDTRSIPAAFFDSINFPQKAHVFHGAVCTDDPQQSSWMRQLVHLSVCVFTARCEDEFLVVKTNVHEGKNLPQNVVSVHLTDKFQVKAITLTNQDLKPLSANRQWIKKASASNILSDPENPYVAMPVDTTIPDEPDPLEHIYDVIPARPPEATCVRTASFGSPQELALRMQQQQQQQLEQQQPVYDVPGRRRPTQPNVRPPQFMGALLAHAFEDPRRGVIPPHIIGLIDEVHTELVRHNITLVGGPGFPYMPSYPVNPPLTPQPRRHYQQPVHSVRQASPALPSKRWYGGDHAYSGPAHNLHYSEPSNRPVSRKVEGSLMVASPLGQEEQQTSTAVYSNIAHPQQTAAHPQQTAAHPQQTAAHPQQTAAHPQQTAAQPQQTAAQPQQTAAQPQQTAAQPMVSDKPNSTPSSTSSQQPPSKSTHKQPPALLPKPTLKKAANTKGPPFAGSPVTEQGVDASVKNLQSDLAQPGTVVAQPTSPLMQVRMVTPGQQPPVPRPRTGHKASPTPKPRRPKGELTASQQVNSPSQDD